MPTRSHGEQPGWMWRVALAGAPPVWCVGWLVLRLAGERDPGPGWTAAHLVQTVGLLLVVAGSTALFRMVGGRRRHLAMAALPLALTGAVALVGQMSVGLVAGWRAADRAELADAVRRLTEPPGLRLVLYDVGPVLLLAGLVALIVLAAGQREGGAGGALLAMIAVVLTAVGRGATGGWRAFEVLGVVFIWLAVLPLLPAPGAPGDTEPGTGNTEPRTGNTGRGTGDTEPGTGNTGRGRPGHEGPGRDRVPATGPTERAH